MIFPTLILLGVPQKITARPSPKPRHAMSRTVRELVKAVGPIPLNSLFIAQQRFRDVRSFQIEVTFPARDKVPGSTMIHSQTAFDKPKPHKELASAKARMDAERASLAFAKACVYLDERGNLRFPFAVSTSRRREDEYMFSFMAVPIGPDASIFVTVNLATGKISKMASQP